MISRTFARYFFTKSTSWAVEKSQLAILRKKTGYTFSNCKKALELHNNDLIKAERWLKEQAQALGWSKATKLEGRQTLQGLVAIAIENNKAALIELNCETDFVARNDTFKTMAETAAKTCLAFAQTLIDSKEPITAVGLDAEQLKKLKAADGKSLADHVALMIGTVGENASLRRAICLKANNELYVTGYAHPSGNEKNSVLFGRFGGVVALKQVDDSEVDIEKVGKELCQHIVGMHPKKIGNVDDEPAKSAEDEECLIYQEYINDENLLVKDVLNENGITVVDFKRFECGEVVNTVVKPLDTLETCQ